LAGVSSHSRFLWPIDLEYWRKGSKHLRICPSFSMLRRCPQFQRGSDEKIAGLRHTKAEL
jgi:hypothetical protein